jgi:hypothetical protein
LQTCNEELHNVIIRVIESRRVGWSGHASRMRMDMEINAEFWLGNPRGRNHLGYLGAHGGIILKCVFI